MSRVYSLFQMFFYRDSSPPAKYPWAPSCNGRKRNDITNGGESADGSLFFLVASIANSAGNIFPLVCGGAALNDGPLSSVGVFVRFFLPGCFVRFYCLPLKPLLVYRIGRDRRSLPWAAVRFNASEV